MKVSKRFTQDEREHIWELYFGKKWSCAHIGNEYGVDAQTIIAAIDAESERRWHLAHPNEVNRGPLHPET